MHFFYLDETGCNGEHLDTSQEPIFVLGGISVRDTGWRETNEEIESLLKKYFSPKSVPENFELHARQLLSPKGEGPFCGHDRGRRNQLTLDLLQIIETRKHQVHYIAIDKCKLGKEGNKSAHSAYNPRIPYLLGFDYITTLIEKKGLLSRTARGILIIDEKKDFHDDIAKITRYRRSEVPKTHRLTKLVEFTYPTDSQKHPMIQLSDLVIYCIKKFLEIEAGHKNKWTCEAKNFYAQCFKLIHGRVRFKTLAPQPGKHARPVNELLGKVVVAPRHNWKKQYRL